MAKKKVFYDLFLTDKNGSYAHINDNNEFDFFHEDVYDVPLKYPHVFKSEEREFPDYLHTNAQPAFSFKLKEIIQKYEKSVKIEWIHIKVEDNEEVRDYYIPRIQPMQRQWDVLSRGATRMNPIQTDAFIVPFLCTEKVEKRDFIRMMENQHIDYVSGELKKEMVKAGITGVEYKKVRTYPDELLVEPVVPRLLPKTTIMHNVGIESTNLKSIEDFISFGRESGGEKLYYFETSSNGISSNGMVDLRNSDGIMITVSTDKNERRKKTLSEVLGSRYVQQYNMATPQLDPKDIIIMVNNYIRAIKGSKKQYPSNDIVIASGQSWYQVYRYTYKQDDGYFFFNSIEKDKNDVFEVEVSGNKKACDIQWEAEKFTELIKEYYSII